MTTTCNHTGISIAGAIRFTMNLTKMLVDDVETDRFNDNCGSTINHPAFVLGHCAYYVGVGMQMLGSDIELSDSDAELYKHGSDCIHLHSGYHTKDDGIAFFMARLEAAAKFVENLDDAVFEKSAEGTFMEDSMPNMGAVATFMMVAHVTFHLGQVSGWRRVAGLGSAS